MPHGTLPSMVHEPHRKHRKILQCLDNLQKNITRMKERTQWMEMLQYRISQSTVPIIAQAQSDIHIVHQLKPIVSMSKQITSS